MHPSRPELDIKWTDLTRAQRKEVIENACEYPSVYDFYAGGTPEDDSGGDSRRSETGA
jgi:hypothetical protein